MQYRKLGNTGLNTSVIGFGAEWMSLSDEQVEAFVARCEDAGINTMDVWMADPEMRRKLGRALANRNSRDKWIIQGHIGSTWQDGQYVRTRDLDQCRAAFENLLELMQANRIELGMIHYVDDPAEFKEIMADSPYIEYIRRLHAAGTIEHIGLSTHNTEVALLAIQHPEIEMIMFSTNPVFDMVPPCNDIEYFFGEFEDLNTNNIDPKRAEVFAECERLGKGITVMKPYAGGRLLDAEKSPFGVAMTPAQCIQYCLDRPGVTCVLAGYSELSHIDDALTYLTASDEQRAYANVLAQAPQHAYMGHCIYCGHCQPCAVGINIAAVNKFYDLATMQDKVPESVREHYLALEATASDCIACGVCETNCPFGVKIADQMQKTADLFGA